MPEVLEKPRVMPMAKAKSKAETTGKKAASAPRPTALTIKGGLEWRAWVERGADHCRTDVAKLVDAALVEYLRSRGFTETPPKR